MPRRILFAIRSKLGDTLISYQCVRAYADAHPTDEVTLLTRSAYAVLLRGEPGIRVIGFNSRIGMVLRLVWLRVTEPVFDVLAVLWGSGPPIRLIGQYAAARRKIAWTKRFAPDLFEEGELAPDHVLIAPAVSAIRSFEPGFEVPRALSIPSLAQRYADSSSRVAVGVVPVADEARRNLDASSLLALVAAIQVAHPHAPVRIFVNPGNAGSEELLSIALPRGCEIRTFHTLDVLILEFMSLVAWYGTDTGLYHLATAIGIPATVFFGPTQPYKIIMPEQTNVRAFRLTALGQLHCEEKSCRRPLCLHAAIATWGNTSCATRLDETPPTCPLRVLPVQALREVGECTPT